METCRTNIAPGPSTRFKRGTAARLTGLLALLLANFPDLHALPIDFPSELVFSDSEPEPGEIGIANWTGAAFDADNIGGSGVNADGGDHNGPANDEFTKVGGFPAQGQAFRTGEDPDGYELTSLTVRVAGYTDNVATGGNRTSWDLNFHNGPFRVRVNRIDGTELRIRSLQNVIPGVPGSAAPGSPGAGTGANGPGTYLTFHLAQPVHLEPDTLYGFDLSRGNNSGKHFEWLGIREDVYSEGFAYTRSGHTYTTHEGDRVFRVDLRPSEAEPFPSPGALHTQEDLDRMRDKVDAGEAPWIESWNLLLASPYAQLGWSPAPVETIVRGGTGNNYTRTQADAAAVYQLALRYHVTGDTDFADRAVFILNEWGSTLQGITGDTNASLGAGIIGMQFASAAELLKTYPGWAPADFERFKEMMVRVFYPPIDDFLWRQHDTFWRNGGNTHYRLNWLTSNMTALMAIGVLTDNRAMYEQAIDYFKRGSSNGRIERAIWYLHPNGLGQGEEAGRDQGHNIAGLDFLARMCQIAWNQGDDLYGYDNFRVLRGLEYLAKYNLGNDVPYTPHRNTTSGAESVVAGFGRGNLVPMYEMIYNHYVNVRGLAAPYSQRAAEALRPEPGPNAGIHPSQLDWFGIGSLTFSRDPGSQGKPPAGLVAHRTGNAVTLNWLGSAGATGYKVKRSVSPGGPYTVIGTTGENETSFTDPDIAGGDTFYYRVSADTPAGETADSAERAAGHSLVARYRFDGNLDDDVSGDTAESLHSPAFAGDRGDVRRTLFLAGDNFVELPAGSANFHDVTLAARVRWNGGGDWQRIFDFGSEIEKSLFLTPRSGASGNPMRFTITTTRVNEGTVHLEAPTLPTGEWVHLAVTISGYDTATLYVDGETVDSAPIAFAPLFGQPHCFIGRSMWNADPLFNGRISDFRIYNHALSELQVASLAGTETAAFAPVDVKAIARSESRIDLSWGPSVDADTYTVKRAESSGGPYTTIASEITDSAYSDTAVTADGTYYYVVSAVNEYGGSDDSAEASAVAVSPPAAPENLSTVAVSSARIDLDWSGAAGADTYRLYRSVAAGGPYTLLAGDLSDTNFSDLGLAGGAEYHYVVTAVGEDGSESDFGGEAKAKTPLAAPGGLRATSGSTRVFLAWEESFGAVEEYLVKRATKADGPYETIATVDASALTYVDTSAVNGETYYYALSARRGEEESESSETVGVVVHRSLWIHLPFDEGSGEVARDATGNGWDAVLQGGASWGEGRSGNALSLSGTDNSHVRLPGGIVERLDHITMAAWVYWDGGGDWQRVFDFGFDTNVYMFLTPQSGGSNVVRFAITTASNGGQEEINGTAALPTGTWTHVAVTISDNTGRLYVNGELAGSNDSMTLQPSDLGATANNWIGRSQWPDPYLNGRVEDFRIYTGALDASELEALVAVGTVPPAPPAGLVATRLPSGEIELDWDPSDGATAYNIWRSGDGGAFELIAEGVTDTAFTDGNVAEGVSYLYSVSAINAAGESEPSAEAAPETPSDPQLEWVRSIELNDGQVSVRLRSMPDHTYQLQRKADLTPGGWEDVGDPFSGTDAELELIDAEPLGVRGFYRVTITSAD